MNQGEWDKLDKNLPLGLLSRFVGMSREVLGENLTGVYLHGSAAMGCCPGRGKTGVYGKGGHTESGSPAEGF